MAKNVFFSKIVTLIVRQVFSTRHIFDAAVAEPVGEGVAPEERSA